MMDIMLLVVGICSFVFSIIGLLAGLIAYTETQAFKKSTHSVQYVGAKPSDIGVSNTPDESNTLNKLNKEYAEEIEEVMPWAATQEEDRQLRSF